MTDWWEPRLMFGHYQIGFQNQILITKTFFEQFRWSHEQTILWSIVQRPHSNMEKIKVLGSYHTRWNTSRSWDFKQLITWCRKSTNWAGETIGRPRMILVVVIPCHHPPFCCHFHQLKVDCTLGTSSAIFCFQLWAKGRSSQELDKIW
jgi:hypothetical protein